jgi:protocatechuate 3,4-dioxygenase beta subunit
MAIGVALSLTTLLAQQRDTPQSPPRGSARVVGRVIAADTGAIVRTAKVTLTALEDRYSFATWIATTDEEGRFDLRDLPPATFTVKIAKAGFVEAAPPNIALKDKPALDLGDLKLFRGGVIAGRVTDMYGEPVVEVAVGATRVFYRTPANKTFQLVESTKTNDLGDFRLYSLQPGSYYVSAGFGTMRLQARDAGQPYVTYANAGTAPALTFHPGTIRADDAQLVHVSAGEQTLADVRLVFVPLATLSGRVVDSKGQPAANFVVMMSAFGQAGGLVFTAHAIEVDAQGAFVVNNLQPGEYELAVVARAALEALGRSGTVGGFRDEAEAAFLTVSVIGDQKDLVIQTSRGFEVRGRIVVDDGAVTPAWLSKLTFTSGQFTGSVRIGPDGSFAIGGLEGHRRLQVYGLPADAVVERVLLYGRDVTDDGFDVNAAVDGIEIAVTTKLTAVAGTIVDSKGETIAGDVIVYAESADLWTKPTARYVKTAHSTADVGFRLAGLLPGRYLVASVGQLDESERANPVNLEKLRAVATPIVLVKGETKTVTLVRK